MDDLFVIDDWFMTMLDSYLMIKRQRCNLLWFTISLWIAIDCDLWYTHCMIDNLLMMVGDRWLVRVWWVADYDYRFAIGADDDGNDTGR